ncbi:MAG: serine hydrolase [Chromatiales bacterium]|jgi:beta-lactamase class A
MYIGCSPRVFAVFILLCLAVIPINSVAKEYFDVSYLWHHDLDSVKKYQQEVAGMLGPSMAKRLKIVAKDGLYGLIYHRHGDNDGAQKVARSHSRILKSRGLESACPVISENWNYLGSGQTVAAETKPAVTASVPRSKMSGSERVQEIRDLEVAVENYIKRLRGEGKIADDERTGWAVYDFTTGEKLVTINEDVQFQAASLVKPFIAAAFFHLVDQGKLIYGNKSRRYMERMIQQSHNPSTNWVMRQVGGPKAAEHILKQYYPGIFRDVHIVEYIPANGRTYLNKASIHDYNRFLYAVWKDEIPHAEEIKRLMSLPGADRIYTGARDLPKGTEVYNKTGSTARLCGDMGILNVEGPDGKRYPYTIIGIIEKQQSARNYSSWIRARGNVIRNVSNIVYKGVAQHLAIAGVM